MEFKKVILEALNCVNHHRVTLTYALAWPFIAIVLIDAAASPEIKGVLDYLLGIVSIAINTIFAITTHRVVLLGSESVSKWGITSWTRRETYFVLYIIGLSLMAVPVMLLVFIPVIGWIAAVVIICWFAGRFSLVFPSLAVDQGLSFGLSWEATENHQLLMFLVVVVFPILLVIPTVILSFVPYTFVLANLASTFVIVFEVAALSVAYRLITASHEQNDVTY